jgi:hypothetical protein
MMITEADFPPHKGSLHLTHNDHRNNYETVEQWAGYNRESHDWVSEEQKAKAIATDSVWVLQWYPDTPVGSHALVAADLDVLLHAAKP